MKKQIILMAAALVALFAAPTAEARGCHSRSYVSYHRSCGGPAWIETYIAFYDRCGHPVLRTRIVPVHRHYHRSACRPVPVCPPTYYRGGCR